MLEFSQELLKALGDALAASGTFLLKSEYDKDAAAKALIERVQSRIQSGKGPTAQHTKAIRGLLAMRNSPINAATAESDANYVRALVTGSTPGSYLVPTLQAGEAIPALTMGGILRASGARVWPMQGIQKENLVVASGLPTVEYLAQTAQQTPSDPNFAQVAFDLKERRALTAIPRRLLATASPAYDILVEELMGDAFGEGEDNAFFSTATVSGGPTSVYANVGNLTSHFVGQSANGGNLAFSDLMRTIRLAVAAKAKGGFVWLMSPRTFYDRVIGMVDTTGQPIFQRDPSGKLIGTVMGYPVFVSPFIPENQTNGSGSSQSYLVFTNPRYLHIADSGSVEIALSEERFFDYNQIAIRGVHAHDFGYAPAAGIVILKGIN